MVMMIGDSGNSYTTTVYGKCLLNQAPAWFAEIVLWGLRVCVCVCHGTYLYPIRMHPHEQNFKC